MSASQETREQKVLLERTALMHPTVLSEPQELLEQSVSQVTRDFPVFKEPAAHPARMARLDLTEHQATKDPQVTQERSVLQATLVSRATRVPPVCQEPTEHQALSVPREHKELLVHLLLHQALLETLETWDFLVIRETPEKLERRVSLEPQEPTEHQEHLEHPDLLDCPEMSAHLETRDRLD